MELKIMGQMMICLHWKDACMKEIPIMRMHDSSLPNLLPWDQIDSNVDKSKVLELVPGTPLPLSRRIAKARSHWTIYQIFGSNFPPILDVNHANLSGSTRVLVRHLTVVL